MKRQSEALELIMSRGCSNYFFTPRGGKAGAECFTNGRTADAEYLADRACPSCIAYRALYGVPVCIEGMVAAAC